MRATEIRPAGTWNPADAADRVQLDHDHRHRRRILLHGDRGGEFLLDLAAARHLHDGDGLVCEDGRIVLVVAVPEPLLEIDAAPPVLLRIAWHLGNRHLPVQFLARRLRVRADHVIGAMVAALGGHAAAIEAPFDPEPGAYAGAGAHHHD